MSLILQPQVAEKYFADGKPSQDHISLIHKTLRVGLQFVRVRIFSYLQDVSKTDAKISENHAYVFTLKNIFTITVMIKQTLLLLMQNFTEEETSLYGPMVKTAMSNKLF